MHDKVSVSRTKEKKQWKKENNENPKPMKKKNLKNINSLKIGKWHLNMLII